MCKETEIKAWEAMLLISFLRDTGLIQNNKKRADYYCLFALRDCAERGRGLHSEPLVKRSNLQGYRRKQEIGKLLIDGDVYYG